MTNVRVASLSINNSQAKAAMAETEAGLRRVGDAAAAVGQTTERETARLRTYGREWQGVEKRMAGSAESLRKFEAMQGFAARAVEAGRITQEQATEAVERYRVKLVAGAAAAARAQKAQEDTARSALAMTSALDKSASSFGGFTGAAKGAFDAMSSGGGIMQAATGQLSGLGGGMSAARVGALALGVGVGVAAGGIALLAAASIQAGDAMTQVEGRLRAATGSIAAAREVYDGLYQISQKSGIAVADSAGQFVRFAIAAAEIGATRKEVVQLVDTVQKFGVVSGSSTQEAQAAAQQLGQALASGKLQGDELRSILENMPMMAQALARELGVSIGQLRAMGTAGELTADRVFRALLKTTDSANKAFESMPMTVERSSAIMVSAWERFTAEIDRSLGRSKALAAAIQGVAGLLNGLTGAIAPETAMDKYLRAQRQVLELQRQINAGNNGPLPEANTIKDLGGDNQAGKTFAEQRLEQLRKEAAALHDAAVAELRLKERKEEDERATAAATRASSAQTAAVTSYKEAVKGLHPLEDALIDRNKKRGEVMAALESGTISFGQAQKDNAAIEANYQKAVEASTHAQRDADKAAKEAAKNEKLVDALQREFDAREQSERAMAVEAATRRLNARASDDERKEVEALAGSLYDLKAARDQDARLAQAQLRLSTVGMMTDQQRDQILTNARISSEAARRFGDTVEGSAAAAAKAKWIDVEQFIATTEASAAAAEKLAQDINATAKDIAKDISESLYDRLMNSTAHTSIVDVFKATFRRIAVAALEAQIVLPITQQIVGSAPGLFGIGGSSSQSPLTSQAANQNGIFGGNSNLLSLGSKFMPSSWTSSITSSIDTWGANALGIGAASQMPTTVLTGANGMLTGGGATSVLPGEVAAGTGLTSYLGPLGIGAGVGGLFGPMLANGNKAVGGLVGAGSGAAAGALAGSFLFPGVGTLVGALLGGAGGGLGGLLGTQKPSVGPTGQATIFGDIGGNIRFVNAQADNGGDAGPVEAAAKAAVTAVNSVYSSFGGKMTAGFGNNPGLISQGGKFEATMGDGLSIGKYDTLDQATVEFTKRVLSSASTGIAADIQTALKNTTAKGMETLAGDIDFAGRFKQTVKSLKGDYGFEDAAAKSANDNADALKKQFEDFAAKTKALGLNTAEAKEATLAYANALVYGRDASKDMTSVEQQMRALELQWVAMPRVFEAAGASAEQAAQMAKDGYANAKAEIQKATMKDYTVALNEAQGRSYLTQLSGVISNGDTVRRNLAAIGMTDAESKASDLVMAQAKSVLQGLDVGQLRDVTTQLGGAVGRLAESMRAAAEATATEDLAVRELRAKGRTAESEALSRSLQQQREVSKAIEEGYSAEYVARLRYVQGLETERAALEAAATLRTAREDLSVRLLRATGQDTAADVLERTQKHVREVVTALSIGADEAYISELRLAQTWEDQKAAAEALAKTATTAAEAFGTLADTVGTAAQSVLDANKSLALTPVAAVSRALGTTGVDVTGPKIAMLNATIDPNERPGLTGKLVDYNDKALAGTLAATDLSGSIGDLTTMLNNAKLAPEQYGAMIDYVTGRFVASQKSMLETATDAASRASAARQGLLGVRETLGGGKRQFGQMLLDQGVDPTTYQPLIGEMNGYLDKARAGTATADDYAGAAIRLTSALNNKRLTEEQYTALLGDLGTAYQSITEKATATTTAMKGLGVTIKNYLDDLKIGDKSTLSPEKKRDTAKELFEQTLKDAKAGDENAISRLTGVADAFLTASLGFNASNEKFATDKGYVETELGALRTSIDKVETPAQKTASATTLSATRLTELNTVISGARTDQIAALKDIKSAQTLMVSGQSAVKDVLAADITSALSRLGSTTENPISKPIVAAVDALRTGALRYLELLVAGNDNKPTALQTAVFGTASQLKDGGDPNTLLTIEGVAVSQARRNSIARALGYAGEFGVGKLQSYMDGNADWRQQFLAAIRLAANPASGILAGAIPGFAAGTPAAPPGWAWVGEQGPELMPFAGGEPVIPNAAAVSMASRWEQAASWAPANDWWQPVSNDRLPPSVATFTPPPPPRVSGGSDGPMRELIAEVKKAREDAHRDAKATADTVIAMTQKQVEVLVKENAELRRRIDKLSTEMRVGGAKPTYAKGSK